MYSDYNLQLTADYTYQEYTISTFQPSITTISGDVTVITTINGGGGGQATGPNITFTGGDTGMNFVAAGNTLSLDGTLNIASGGTGAATAAGARTNLGAAASGVNADITMFTGLSGVAGWQAWTGTGDRTTHATYSATADALYNQAQIQALMDKVKELTEALKAIIDTNLGSGVFEL
jgi:hypothetical protein